MRADRPLLVSAAFLGAGLWLIFRYGTTGGAISTAQPWFNTGFHVNLAASGPGVISGVAFVAIGALLLVWAIFAALVWHASLLADRDDDSDFLRILSGSSSEESDDLEDRPSEPLSGHRRFL